jgi:hypothetical protein
MPVKTTKAKAKPKIQKKTQTESRGKTKSAVTAKSRVKAGSNKSKSAATAKPQVVNRIAAPRIEKGKPAKSARVIPQYAFMKAPGSLHDFQVGKKIEVYCDHDKSKERIRGWIAGVIVQVDNKMVAVQFQSNVYLTDGWMVPDRILWYPLNSEHVRAVGSGKNTKKAKAYLDY